MDGYKTRYSQENTLGSEGKMKHFTYRKSNKYGVVTHHILLFDFGRKHIGIGCKLSIETVTDLPFHNPLITFDRTLRIGRFVCTRKLQTTLKWVRIDKELHYNTRASDWKRSTIV